MLTFKDRTFCSSKVRNHTCGRKITQKELKDAEKVGLPIAYGEFCEVK